MPIHLSRMYRITPRGSFLRIMYRQVTAALGNSSQHCSWLCRALCRARRCCRALGMLRLSAGDGQGVLHVAAKFSGVVWL